MASTQHSLSQGQLLNAMDPCDLGWVAGIIEGEGCIRVHTPSPGRPNDLYPQVRVAMTDEDVVCRLHEITGVGAFRAVARSANTKAHHKSQYAWSVNAVLEVYALLLAVRPILAARRGAAADELLALCEVKLAVAELRKEFCKRGHRYADTMVVLGEGPRGTIRGCGECRNEAIVRQIETRRQRNIAART